MVSVSSRAHPSTVLLLTLSTFMINTHLLDRSPKLFSRVHSSNFAAAIPTCERCMRAGFSVVCLKRRPVLDVEPSYA